MHTHTCNIAPWSTCWTCYHERMARRDMLRKCMLESAVLLQILMADIDRAHASMRAAES